MDSFFRFVGLLTTTTPRSRFTSHTKLRCAPSLLRPGRASRRALIFGLRVIHAGVNFGTQPTKRRCVCEVVVCIQSIMTPVFQIYTIAKKLQKPHTATHRSAKQCANCSCGCGRGRGRGCGLGCGCCHSCDCGCGLGCCLGCGHGCL